MKKVPFIFLILILCFSASAQELLDTVVVSSARFKQSLLNSNRNVQIIAGDDLAKAPVNSIAEILDFALGVDARQRGIFGTQTDLSIRGGSFEQVLVLINGIRIADPQTGHHLMNLPVAKEDIERIEILLGGGSYIFGANAFSGAINIITKEALENSSQIGISGGQYGTIMSQVQQNIKTEKSQTRVSGSINQSDGFIDNTDFKHYNLSLQSELKWNKDQIQVQGGYTNQGFGAQNFYSTNFPDQYEKTKTLFGSVNWQGGEKVSWDRSVYWRRNWDEFQLFREEGNDFYNYNNGLFISPTDTAPTWYAGHNYHRSDVAGAKMDASWENRFGSTALGFDYRYEQVLSNNLGDSLSEAITFEDSRKAYFLSAQRHNISLSGQHLIKAGPFQFSAAMQVNYNSDFGLGFYPAINTGYRFLGNQKLFASYNRSFRFPSFTDLYYRLGGARGSQDLEQERSNNYELGYRFSGNGWYSTISVFHRGGTSIIDWTQACDTCDLIANNSGDVNFTGLEFSLRKNLKEQEKTAWFKFLELSYSYLQSSSPSQMTVYRSLYVFDHLRHKVTLRASQNIGTNLSLNYGLSYQDRNGEYFDGDLSKLLPYPDVFLINIGLNYAWGDFQFNIKGQNLLNQQYFDRGNVPLPGMWLQGGLVYKIKY
jgi:vitamin B12 transporter